MLSWFKKKPVEQSEQVQTEADSETRLMKDTLDFVMGENAVLENQRASLVASLGLLQAEYQRLTNLRNSLMVLVVAYAGYSITIPNDFVDGVNASMDADDLTVTYEQTEQGMTLRVLTTAEAQEMIARKKAEEAGAASCDAGCNCECGAGE